MYGTTVRSLVLRRRHMPGFVLHQINDYLGNNPTTEKIETNKGIAVNNQGFLELKSGKRKKKIYTGAPHVRKS